jgi:UDP-N-acetylglucosamine diphosphorylase / glucose-1-phosphate thymidylyltransferase / UDP-N-acetylgalactosamine diphosphorylase / glucosamine-1-phosphate N-acetyltransferase / galactosamine-1-phosphate N-acetyltransferase
MQITDFFSSYSSLYKDKNLLSPLLEIEHFFAKTFLGKIETTIPQGVFLEDKEKISIGKNTIVEPGAYIKGPCIIGQNCQIRHGAYIRGYVKIDDHCIIGHGTEVKNSFFFSKAKACHFCYVGNSILGKNVNLGASVVLANLRLDHKDVMYINKGKKIKTGLQKMGAIIGDNVQIGCNTVLSPGTLIAKDCVVYPCLSIRGSYQKNSQIRKGIV